jgi:hypothetical protein
MHRARKAGAPAAATKPVTAAKVPSGPNYPYLYTRGEIDRAVAKAVNEERGRMATVFAAGASHGRERVCAALLTSSKNFGADAIVAELPNLPTDEERARNIAAGSEANRQRAAQASTKARAELILSDQRGTSPAVPSEQARRILADQKTHLSIRRS